MTRIVTVGGFMCAIAMAMWTSDLSPRLLAQQGTTFRGGGSVVPVYASVVDRSGGFVLNLTKDDFEVRDNGKVQEISQFATDAQPLSVLILIDGSSSMLPAFNTVIEAANGFILRMLPADRTAIASFADQFQMRQPFTSNRDELLAHLRDEFNIRMASETRLWEAMSEGVLALTRETNRRVILVLTDGKQWVNDPRKAYMNPSMVVSSALSSDVAVYAIAMWTREANVTERPDPMIETMAADTGGGFAEVHESNDIGSVLTGITGELHQEYVIGFIPQLLDGKVHKLDVKVKRGSVTVRARRSYIAPKAGGD